MLGEDFSCDGEVYRLVDDGDEQAFDPEEFEAVPAFEVRRLVRQWWWSGHRRTVVELTDALATPWVGGTQDDEAVLSALCHAADRWVVLRRLSLSGTVDPDPPATDLLDLLPEDRSDDPAPDHFVELTFVDADGEPVSSVACRVELPNGMVRHARSNDAGVIRIEGLSKPGQCIVTFDAHDDVAVDLPPNPVPPTPPPAHEQTFELTLVDELGEPIAGAELSISGTKTETATTDDQGRVTLTGESVETCLVELDFEALRDELAARWDGVRPGEYVEDTETASVRLFGDENPVLLFAGEPHVISIQPRVDRLIANGLLFDTSKSFLLPTALPAMRTVVEHYARMPEAEVLVVGHTDQAGDTSYNAVLSEERAGSMAAFLQDDVEGWLPFYGPGTSWEKRWGAHEDSLMLAALPDFADKPPGTSAVRWFQESRGLTVDGVAGDETRRALIRDYMAIDGTTLPAAATVNTHGCGESFPEAPGPDGTASAPNRRVEVFFFRGDLGVQPPPPGAASTPSDPEYPEWVRRAINTLEEEVEDFAETLHWREGSVDGAGAASFVIRDTATDEHEKRNAATPEHDLSKLPNEQVVELGVHESDSLAPLRHRHRVDVGKLRAALRLADHNLLREAMALVVAPAAPPPTLPPDSFPWEGEPITEIQPAGEF